MFPCEVGLYTEYWNLPFMQSRTLYTFYIRIKGFFSFFFMSHILYWTVLLHQSCNNVKDGMNLACVEQALM